MQPLKTLALVAIVASTIGTARATIILQMGNVPQMDENVLFNEDGLLTSGNLVQGATNQTFTIVNFQSPSNLSTPSAGQARVVGPFIDLNLFLSAAVFTSAILNLDATADGTVEFIVSEPTGETTEQSFTVGAAGSNFFTITAVDGQQISNISLSGSGTTFADVAQVRIGGAQAAGGEPGDIPEPATWALMGGGILAFAVVARGRRRG
jgi:hypothetical protein